MTELTRQEIERFTGYKRRADQLRHLRDVFKIEPFVSARGELIVFRSVMEDAQRRASGFELQQAARKGPRPRLVKQ